MTISINHDILEVKEMDHLTFLSVLTSAHQDHAEGRRRRAEGGSHVRDDTNACDSVDDGARKR